MIVGAMDVNAGRKPPYCEHPALGTYFVYGIFLRLFDMLNILSVSDSNQLSLLTDPLSKLPGIYYAGRVISIIIAMICAMVLGVIMFLATRSVYLLVVGTVLSLFSCGLFFQSLIIRTELISVVFALISIATIFLSLNSKHKFSFFYLLILSGFFFGSAIFTKVQILPFLFLVPTIIFEFVRRNRKKFICVFSYQVIIYSLSIGFLIVFLLFINNLLPEKQFYRTIIIVVYIVALSLLLRLKAGMQDMRMACFLTNFFAVGILLSVIFTLNYFNYDLNSKKVLANQFFSPWNLTNRNLMDFNFHSIMTNSISYVFYYLRFSLILYAVIFLIFFCKEKRYPFFFLSLWIIYIVFSSTRIHGGDWYGIKAHYLIYSDLFLNAAFLSLIYQILKEHASVKINFLKTSLNAAHIKNLIMIFILFSGLLQFGFIREYYPKYNLNYRNRIDLTPFCIYSNKAFNKMLIEKYGNNYNVFLRIYADPDLNGQNRGTDIMEIPFCKKFYLYLIGNPPERFQREL